MNIPLTRVRALSVCYFMYLNIPVVLFPLLYSSHYSPVIYILS